jgi:uncharacterized protein YkwD
LVNEARAKGCQCGDTWYPAAKPLSWNDLLEAAALRHARDMNQNKFFSHTGKDGSDAGGRITETGYRWTFYGENIAFGHRTEEEVVRGWISSPGHCKNLMNPNYKEMGIARSGNYWTQDFGTR